MTDSDSFRAGPLPCDEATAADEAGAGRMEDAAAVPDGQGIATGGGGADEGARRQPDGSASGTADDDDPGHAELRPPQI